MNACTIDHISRCTASDLLPAMIAILIMSLAVLIALEYFVSRCRRKDTAGYSSALGAVVVCFERNGCMTSRHESVWVGRVAMIHEEQDVAIVSLLKDGNLTILDNNLGMKRVRLSYLQRLDSGLYIHYA